MQIGRGSEVRWVMKARAFSLAVHPYVPISTLRSPMGTSKPQGCLFNYSFGGPLNCTSIKTHRL